MEILIIYKSRHRGNTEKVAKAMVEVMNAKLLKVEDVQPQELTTYDLIGFGSGIYGGKHDKKLIKLIENMSPMDKSVFIFSTYGGFKESYHTLIKERLSEKGCKIVGEFSCLGVFGILRLSMNKGHPDEKDLENARTFVKGLINA